MKNTLKTKQNKNPTLPRGPLVHQGLQTRRCGYELGGQPASRARVGGASADPALASLGRVDSPASQSSTSGGRSGVSIWSQRRAIEVEPASSGGLGAQEGPQHGDSAEEVLAAAQASWYRQLSLMGRGQQNGADRLPRGILASPLTS